MDGEVFGFEEATAKQILRQLNRPQTGSIPRSAPFSNPFTGLRIAYTTGGATARSGSTCGSGTATLYTIDAAGSLTSTGSSVTFYNWVGTAVGTNRYIVLGAFGQTWVVVAEDCP